MKKIFFSVFALLFSFLIVTCGSSGYRGYAPRSERSAGSTYNREGNENQRKPVPGQLTCGEWSDIKNYQYYLDLFDIVNDPDIEESQRRISYSQFINYFGFETRFMVTVNVSYNRNPADDVIVELYDSNQNKLFTARTDARGNAYLFPSYDLTGENIFIKARSGNYELERSFIYTNDSLHITLDNYTNRKSVLDLMFVIDTTGSMADELRYLKAEISDVIAKISSENPDYTINLALLFYRDFNDEYVTRYFDFSENISQQQLYLSRQSAGGGGDFPEAVDTALSEAVDKNWSIEQAVRIIFHVCDAPPHNTQENQTLYYNSIKKAAEKGIRIIPVASSGIDYATEYLLRQEALMTGGTYIFLTDESGIGYSHLQPTVGEYTVEYLNACLVRVINEYLTGEETEPVMY